MAPAAPPPCCDRGQDGAPPLDSASALKVYAAAGRRSLTAGSCASLTAAARVEGMVAPLATTGAD